MLSIAISASTYCHRAPIEGARVTCFEGDRHCKIAVNKNYDYYTEYMRIHDNQPRTSLLSGGKPPISGLLCSAGTALTRAHTIRRFCGAKEKEPRATRRGGPRCDWPNRSANQGRHLRSRIMQCSCNVVCLAAQQFPVGYVCCASSANSPRMSNAQTPYDRGCCLAHQQRRRTFGAKPVPVRWRLSQ